MDLGVLSLLVGQQIGKQKKNEYQQKLADEKQKAQEEFERQKEKMLFVDLLFVIFPCFSF